MTMYIRETKNKVKQWKDNINIGSQDMKPYVYSKEGQPTSFDLNKVNG